jgi:hypothetical protein
MDAVDKKDVAAYQAALREVGLGVPIPAKAERQLCDLATRGTHLHYDFIWGKDGKKKDKSEFAAPPDVALAIAHGRFKDGERRLLVFPPDDTLLAHASTWADSHRGRFGSGSYETPLAQALDAIVYGLKLGGEDVRRDRSGKILSEAGYGGYVSWFEVQVPEPEKHGLPGPCFLRGLRSDSFVPERVHLLRGVARDPLPVTRKPKRQWSFEVRLVVPGGDPKRPRGWLSFEAWDPMFDERRLSLPKISAPRWEK